MKKFILHIALVTLIFISATTTANAQTCKSLYGGGITDQQVCGTKISTPASGALPKATPTPISIKSGSTTKGGLPVLSPTQTKKTPSTGPEVLGFIGLIPAGALGYYLRKKA